MKKLTKKDYINIGLLLITVFLIIFVILKNNNIYGSTLDWRNQHSIIPNYFRQLFYNNKNIFPNFAFNIGSGQNIYYLAYYGLFNPIVLISYLLPFVPMVTFISISSIFIVVISMIMFYIFLRKHEFNELISFIGTFIFLCSGPLIFHSHRHIMFINYMPVLILGLYAIDYYFKTNKRWLLIISVFLIILTSYYYSVSALLVLGIYGIYSYLKLNKDLKGKKIIKDAISFGISFIIGIILAAFLLLPVIYVITQGRVDANVSHTLINYLKPTLNIGFLLYSPYSIGLSVISFMAIISLMFSKKKEYLFLGIILLLIIIFPIFTYLLNGKIYLAPKVLIPFLPLLCYIITIFIKNILEKKEPYLNRILVLTFSLLIISFILTKHILTGLAIIEFIIITILICIFKKTNKKSCIYLSIIISSFIICLGVNLNDKLVTKNNFNNYNNKENELNIIKTIKKEPYIYRLENQLNPYSNMNKIISDKHYTSTIYSSLNNNHFHDFNFNIFKNDIPFRNNATIATSKNILFQTYMGIKYVLTKTPNLGYTNTDKTHIYENNNTLPISYASNNLLSLKEFNKLTYPYTVDALLNYIIVDTNKTTNYIPNVKPIKLDYTVSKQENLIINKDKYYHINADEKGHLTLKLDKTYSNKIIIIKFKMLKSQSCEIGDTSITINGVKNTLTCKSAKYHNKNYDFEYVIGNDSLDKLDISFKKGEYLIDDINTYIMDYDYVKNIKNNVDELFIDKNKTKGDNIFGMIDVKNDGYLYFSIPYDKGFKIYLNNKLADYEKVDTSFIGLPIKSGHYNVKVTYEAPLSKLGQNISIVGIICFIGLTIYDNKKRSK